MLRIKEYRAIDCNFCGKQITLESPPSKKRYNNAEIHLDGSSSILLPEALVEQNVDNGHSESHSCSLEGYYCKPDCLVGYITRLLTPKERIKKQRRA